MSFIYFPMRSVAAAVAFTLSVTSACAAEDEVVKPSAPAGVAATPAAPAAAADKPVATASAQKANTDLGAARIATARRTVAHRVIHRPAPQPIRLSCSGIWCGRQFVLMLGIAY